MTGAAYRRARSEAQKAERRAALLQAAAQLLDEGDVEAVTLTALARAVGLAKSNVYTYFESREHILLELLYEEWTAWLGEAELALLGPGVRGDPGQVAARLADGFAQRPRLTKLAAIVTTVLERNVSEEAIAAFKTRALSLGIRFGAMLHAALPDLDLDRCQQLLTPTFALVAGLWPMCNPPPPVARVLQRPEFAAHSRDFTGELRRSLSLLLLGALAEHERGPR